LYKVRVLQNAAGGGQNQQSQDGDRLCINMVDAKIDVATRSRDYSSKKTIPGLEAPPPPLEMNLQIVDTERGVNQYQVQFKTFFNLYLNHSTISNEK
jgi:hypothetical protein